MAAPDIRNLIAVADAFTLGMVIQRLHAPTSAEEWLFDSRTSLPFATTSVSLAPTTGNIRVYRGTTIVLESADGIADGGVHSVIIRSTGFGTTTYEIFLDGFRLIFGTASGSNRWRRVSIANRVDGTKPFVGIMQDLSIHHFAVSDATIAAMADAALHAQGGLVYDYVSSSLKLSGLLSFASLLNVNVEPNIWYAGGVAPHGRYYFPAGEGLDFATPRPVKIAPGCISEGFNPYLLVKDVPDVASLVAFDGDQGASAHAVMESVSGQDIARTGGLVPWLPLRPKRYTDKRHRFRLSVDSDSPAVACEVSQLSVTADVDDLVLQDAHVPTGAGLTVLGSGSVQKATFPAGITIPVTTAIPEGWSVIVIAATQAGRVAADSIQVTDGNGNLYFADSLFASGGGAISVGHAMTVRYFSIFGAPGDHIDLGFDGSEGVGIAAVAVAVPGQVAIDRIATYAQVGLGTQPGTYPIRTGTTDQIGAGGELVFGAFGIGGHVGDAIAPDGEASAVVPPILMDDGAALFVEVGVVTSTAGMLRKALVTSTAEPAWHGLLAAYQVIGGAVTDIRFPTQFNGAHPVVQVAIEGAQPGDAAEVTNVSSVGFSVRVLDLSGTTVPRQISWIATGY